MQLWSKPNCPRNIFRYRSPKIIINELTFDHMSEKQRSETQNINWTKNAAWSHVFVVASLEH